MKQDTAFKILKEYNNVFLTGAAGTGKTFLLNKYINYCRDNNINVAVTASTGIAATHLSGRTIHSWAGIGIAKQLEQKEIEKILKKPTIRERIAKTDVLIIDEISMLHASQLDLIDKILRLGRSSWEPFGGIQVILSGDMFQLPPIITNSSEEVRFVHMAQSWKELNIKVCYLTQQHRQDDEELVKILNSIRNGTVDSTTMYLLQTAMENSFNEDDEITKLFTHNRNVDDLNLKKLKHIHGSSKTYSMKTKGVKAVAEVLKNSCLAPENLQLKEGAFVMFVRNNFEEGYVNGTLGVVIDFEDNMPVIETRDGDIITVYPEQWSIEEDGKKLATVEQLPLRLAWAITIHKSQGMTLDAAEIDLSRSFEYGMGYVALSRVRALNSMQLLGINDTALMVNPEILQVDKEFQKISMDIESNYN